jgi:uncharacterized membrane protein YgdD (TMEM256/DUF423 family)
MLDSAEFAMKPPVWLACGAILAALAVASGAFGAHLLKPRIARDPALSAEEIAKRLETYETAARYHMYHAIALVLLGLAATAGHPRAFDLAGGCFLVGIAVFSGGCYALALGAPKILGAIVPIGGLSFIAGWLALAFGALRR